MTILYVAEFSNLPVDLHGAPIMAPMMPPVTEQTISIGSSSAQSSVYNSTTRFLQVHTDHICSVEYGTAADNAGSGPTATTSSGRMAANETRFVGVTGGDQLAVITNT